MYNKFFQVIKIQANKLDETEDNIFSSPLIGEIIWIIKD